jgi:hypothetical protein
MMEATVMTAMSGVLGSLVGGSTMAWITQSTLHKREMLREEVRKRETLYGEFIGECAKLLMDALAHTLEKPETLQPAYALLNRIRLTASPSVLTEGEQLLRRITDQYFASNLTIEDLRKLARTQDADPLRTFGEACRMELRSLRALVSRWA